MDLTGCEGLFGSPLDIAQRIMKDIQKELDLWCSIGISENKFLSKMASERKKPLGITEIWKKDVPKKLWPLPIREMYGIGKQTEKKLVSLGINLIGDIAAYDLKLLRQFFWKYGHELKRLSNGEDASPVSDTPHHQSKSISRSTTLPEDTADLEFAKDMLFRLAEDVGTDARRQGLKGKTVTISIKYSDFQTITRQKSISPTYLTRDIYRTGSMLLDENWNSRRPVRLLGIGLSNFQESESSQISIFDIGSTPENDKEEKIEKTIDSLRARFGADKIKRAKTL
ncbi:MAG: DNA polymerase IV [Clostridia bacterium]|nr:DNA polymerase IV [Clostridia bacterium]